MVKKKTNKAKRSKTQSQPNSMLLKKISSISDSTELLSKEVKGMTKIFTENQKILISLKNMIDGLGTALSEIQKQSKQIRIIEEDTQKLFVGFRQAKKQSNLIEKINEQTNRLQEWVNKVHQKQESLLDSNQLMQSVRGSLDSIRNNTKMIMRVSDRMDSVQNEVTKVTSTKDESFAKMTSEIRNVGTELDSLGKKTDSFTAATNNIRNIQEEFTNFKENVVGKTIKLDEKISDLTELLNRNTQSVAESNKKTHEIHQGLQELTNITHKTSENTSREVLGLLRLSEHQSNIRMHSESEYGNTDDLEKMVSLTVEMVNLFDKLSIETEKKMPLPQEVKRWAVSKTLDAADKWEIRFSDVFRILVNELGRDLLKESLRVQQVKDLFGIRAVDEIRQELDIS